MQHEGFELGSIKWNIDALTTRPNHTLLAAEKLKIYNSPTISAVFTVQKNLYRKYPVNL